MVSRTRFLLRTGAPLLFCLHLADMLSRVSYPPHVHLLWALFAIASATGVWLVESRRLSHTGVELLLLLASLLAAGTLATEVFLHTDLPARPLAASFLVAFAISGFAVWRPIFRVVFIVLHLAGFALLPLGTQHSLSGLLYCGLIHVFALQVARRGAQERRTRFEQELHALQDRKIRLRDDRLTQIGRTTSRLAHDLRNALGVIMGTTQLAATDSADLDLEALDRDFQDLEATTKRASRMVNEILDYASGEHRLDLAPISIANRLMTIASFSRRHLLPPTIRLTVEARGEAIVFVDPERFHRCIENLLINARQALQQHGVERPEILLTLESTSDLVIIEVSDNGPGIPQALAGNLFEDFTSEKSGGIGLGLANCKEIVEQHNGRISAGHRNSGASFRIELPRVTQDLAVGL